MPNIGPLELIFVLVIALLLLGPKRLPDAGRSLGRSIREFRHGLIEVRETPETPAPSDSEITHQGTPTPATTVAQSPGSPASAGDHGQRH